MTTSDADGLSMVIERGIHSSDTRSRSFVDLELLGADRPGVVHMVTEVLAVMGINVDELETACLRAPMCGDPLFKVSARLGLPEEANMDDLREALEALADELMVDLSPASDLTGKTEATLVL